MPTIVTPKYLQQRAELYYQLGMLTSAGVTILQALETLRRKPVRRGYSAPLGELILHIQAGSTFTEAMKKLGHFMPAFDVAIINAGEQSGRLDQCFKLLSDHYKTRVQLLREMIGGLTYPIFIFLFAVMLFPTSLLAGLVLRGEVIPFLVAKAMILVPVVGIAFAIAYAFKSEHGEKWQAMLERLLHAIPLLGGALRDLALSRLAAALEALISAGVTIVEAWQLAAGACGSHTLKGEIAGWVPALEAGKTPADEITASAEFPEMFANLYHSGEISGQLDTTLKRLYDHYLEEGRLKLQTLAKWIPKLIYILIMVGIAWQVLSFYVGYFQQINNAIGQ